MNQRRLYLILCASGIIIPYAMLLPCLVHHGFDPGWLLSDILASRTGLFCAADVVLSAIVLFRFARIERKAGRLEQIWPIYAGTLLVGVSFGFPLMLYLRARKMQCMEIDA